jgi:hypothetical protein
MKRTLVVVVAIAVSACSPAAVRSAADSNTLEAPDLAPVVAQTESVTDGQNESGDTEPTELPGDGQANPPVVETATSVPMSTVPQTTTPSSAAAATTTTTSTMPEIALDLDLSELDELLGELNGLLGGLGSVMNQSEGEITP